MVFNPKSAKLFLVDDYARMFGAEWAWHMREDGTKMSQWVQISVPSNRGLDVVSSHFERNSAYCHDVSGRSNIFGWRNPISFG